ncbi:MAG: tetratricopeptide repeat protein, partial [Gemmatimonadota bacterium]|nr:tetratricopeptide repeat protein [Gemmatimonadota bacterium]
FIHKPPAFFKVREMFGRLKTYRLLSRTWRGIRGGGGGGAGTGPVRGASVLSPEVQTILDRSAGLDHYQRDPGFSRGVFEHFRYNLSRIRSLCREAGVPVVFLEPVDNIKDFSPFKSQGRKDLPGSERETLARAVSEGLALLGGGRFEEAAGRFTEAVAIDTLHAGSCYTLGRVCLETGDTAAARRYLLRARELDVCPLRAREPVYRALRAETAGNDAPDLLDLPALFSSLSPGGLIGGEVLIDHIHPFPEGHMRIALEILGWMNEKGFVQENRLPGAGQLDSLYGGVMDSLPPEYFSKGIINLAKVLIWAKKHPEAMAVLESRWDLLESQGEARYLMGSALLEMGAPREAAGHFRRALELAGDHIMVLVELAPLYARLGRTDSAAIIYERGLRLYPDNVSLLSGYGMLQNQLGKPDKAIELLVRAQRLEPDAPDLDIRLGTVYSMAGRYSQALEAFTRAKETDPGNPEVYYNLGNLYAVRNEIGQAEGYFLETVRRDPVHASAHINLGNIYQNTGRVNQAEEQFRLVLETAPNLIAPYVNLAMLYKSAGRDPEARKMAALGLEHFPGDPVLEGLAEGGP